MGDRIRRNRIDSKDYGPGDKVFSPVVTGGTPGYQRHDNCAVEYMGRQRVNDMRHILDVRNNTAKAPNFFGARQGKGPTIATPNTINRNSRIALHTERTQLRDYGHGEKRKRGGQ